MSAPSWVTETAAKWWFTPVAAIIVFLLGTAFGTLVFFLFYTEPVTITSIHDPDAGYSFINPTLYTESPEALSYPRFSPLKTAISSYIATAEKNGAATNIGVYYRDLNSTDWIGINADTQFDPASMMKVATLIAFLRATETQPEILNAKITIPASLTIPSTGTQDYYPPADPIKSGNTFSTQDLLQRLIVQSDNGSDAVLIDYLGNKAMATVYSDLHLPTPGTTSGITPQNYSHLFRALYNATYLNSSDSEEALQLLSRTDFTSGLVAGVPAGTVVSHKFGESYDGGTPGLNDCGIIYNKTNPYFLCIMTKGTDFSTLAGVIKDISAITWQQVGTLTS